jgi:ubiquinone/menaquinone biosynthesis C-methylase UbiE
MMDYSDGKKILDCGAGGPFPKLALFCNYGYEAYGLEISDARIKDALEYAQKKGILLNIQKGDMRQISFESDTFDFVYSYNTIFHLNKVEIGTAINEMFRVLKCGGLCYLNLLSYDDSEYGKAKEIAPGEFLEIADDERITHTYFRDDEPDVYFAQFKILYKEKRTVLISDTDYRAGMIDYIVKKEC